MKSFWYAIIISTFLIGCESANKKIFSDGDLIVNFKIEQLEKNKIVLECITSSPKVVQLDTIETKNGIGKFIYTAQNTSFYSLHILGKDGEIRFMANPGEVINVSGNANLLYASAKIGGTPENSRLDSLITYIKATRYYTDSLDREFNKKKSKEMHHIIMDKFDDLYAKAKRREEKFVIKYVLKNPGQFSNLLAKNSLDKNRHKEIFQIIDSALLNNFPTNGDVIKFHENIEKQYSFAIGKKAPNFTLLSSEGKTISLSDYKGKYVLLDFWNTNCQPCIQQIPTLKKIQQEFRNDNFEMISICIDRNNSATQEVWRKINEKYETKWIQVYDSDGLATARNYRIRNYPTMVIVDPSGKIINEGKYLTDEVAYQTIKNLLTNE